MIFTVDRGELASAISRAAQGLPSHPAQPVYAGMKLQADGNLLSITASDEEGVRFTATTDCDAETEGSCIVPGRLLTEISRFWGSDTVSCEYQAGLFRIRSGRSAFTLPAEDGKSYPAWDSEVIPFLKLDGQEFAAALRAVTPAASRTGMITLAGINMELDDSDLLKLVCTDRSRMAVAEVPFDEHDEKNPGIFRHVRSRFPGSAILPARTGERFARDCDGKVYAGWSDSLVIMRYEGTEMLGRRIAGEYPPWRTIRMPEGGWTQIPVKELARAVKMAQLVTTTPVSWITLAFGDEGIIVSADEEGRECREYVPCDCQGKGSVTLGAQFLLDGLAGCGEIAEVAYQGAFCLRSEGFQYMIQPRREI